jgi:phosphoribosyl-dephospho-CoA transferase
MRCGGPFKRHDLVWLDRKGKNWALGHIQSAIPAADPGKIEALIFSSPPIPAIVCSQFQVTAGLLRIGFSSPEILEGLRFRVSAEVPRQHIVKHRSPFQVIQKNRNNLPDYTVLETLRAAGRRCHTVVGLYGSAALELATGLPYRRKDSDLDLYIRHRGTWAELSRFYEILLECESAFQLSIDGEIECPGRYGVKLKELFAPGTTVLGKGQRGIVLLDKGKLRSGLIALDRGLV